MVSGGTSGISRSFQTTDAIFDIAGCPGLEPPEVPATGTWHITFDPSGGLAGNFLEDGLIRPFLGSLDLSGGATCDPTTSE